MGNQYNGCAKCLAYQKHFFHHLLLNRYIQSGSRLVCEENFRFQKHSRRNSHTLLHTSGELKWITGKYAFSIRKSKLFEDIQSLCLEILTGNFVMLLHSLVQLRSYRSDRTKGASRILKDKSKLWPVQQAQFFCRKIWNVLPHVPDIAACYHSFLTKKSHGRFNQCGFSATALSNNAKNFSRCQSKTYILDGWNTIVCDVYLIIL